jgi:hypothetical protein
MYVAATRAKKTLNNARYLNGFWYDPYHPSKLPPHYQRIHS